MNMEWNPGVETPKQEVGKEKESKKIYHRIFSSNLDGSDVSHGEYIYLGQRVSPGSSECLEATQEQLNEKIARFSQKTPTRKFWLEALPEEDALKANIQGRKDRYQQRVAEDKK